MRAILQKSWLSKLAISLKVKPSSKIQIISVLLIVAITMSVTVAVATQTNVIIGQTNSDKEVRLNQMEPTLLWKYTTNDVVVSSPALSDIDGDNKLEVVIGSNDGNIYALNGEDGSLLWKYTIGSGVLSSPAIGDIDNDGNLEIVVGSNDHNIYALNGENGSLLWTYKTGGIVESSPALGDINNDGKLEVVIGSDDNNIYALNGEDGSLLWTYRTGDQVHSSPALGDIDGDQELEIVIGSNDGNVYALNGEDGSPLWIYRTEGQVESSPALGDIDNDDMLEVIIGSRDHNIYALNGEDGSLLWKFLIAYNGDYFVSPISSIALGDVDDDGELEVVVSAGIDGQVHVLKGRDGFEVWHNGWTGSSSPALGDIDGDNKLDVVVGSYQNYIAAFEGMDGFKKWKFNTDNDILSSPALGDIDNDSKLEIVVGSNDRGIYALDFPEKYSGYIVYWACFGGTPKHTRNTLDWDPDKDMLSDSTEKIIGTDPLNADTDGDELPDGMEIVFETDPLNRDTDGDGLPDGVELRYGADPLNADSDGDGLSDSMEVMYGTDPLKVDTDGDGLIDSSDPYPTNWLLPHVVFIIGFIGIAVGGTFSVVRKRKRKLKALFNRVVNECNRILQVKGIVNCKRICLDKGFNNIKSIVYEVTKEPRVISIDNYIVAREDTIYKLKDIVNEALKESPKFEDQVAEQIEQALSIDKDTAMDLLDYVCKSACIKLPSGKICSKEYLSHISNEIANYEKITPEIIHEKHPELSLEDVHFILSEMEKEGRIIRSSSKYEVYYSKEYLGRITDVIDEKVLSKFEIITPETIAKALDMSPEDVEKYIIDVLVAYPKLIATTDKKKFYKIDYLVNEVNKLFNVYEQLRISSLADQFGIKREDMEKILVDAIASGMIRARIKGDIVTFIAAAPPTTAPVPSVTSKPESIKTETRETIMIPNYKILGIIGGGGFATVFRARDQQGRLVALKVLTSADDEMKKIFAREVSLWKVLKHPNIVMLLDFGVDPMPFMSMELMDGSLRDLMKQKRFTIKEALEITLQIALALDYAHRDFNIVHRDIKPENILYKGDTYKLSDWGLAGVQTVMSLTTGYKGTIAYSAPEQFDASVGRIGPWTDVWQLGVVLYELISGKLPFGNEIGTVVRNVLYNEPERPEGISDELWSLIQDMLQKNPEDRINLVEVIKRIRNLQAPEGIRIH